MLLFYIPYKQDTLCDGVQGITAILKLHPTRIRVLVMKKKYTWRILGLVACLFFGIVTVSCHKEEDEITEEQARIVLANAEVVMDNVSKIYEASETVEEMEQHLDEIKAMANVEDAYRDDIAICVKIKDGGIIMWCFYPEEGEDEKAANVEELFKNISKDMYSGKGGSVCEEKSICLLNTINYSGEDGYDNVIKKFHDVLHWNTCTKKDNEVTPEFIRDIMPTYGVIILHVHGWFFNEQHWWETGLLFKDATVNWLETYKLWRNDLWRLIFPTEKDDIVNSYVLISETYLEKAIEKNFKKNSILFLSSCAGFYENNNLWLTLKKKGLGCILGLNNLAYSRRVMNSCVMFMEEMIDGKTASEAYTTVHRNIQIIGPNGAVDLLCYPENCDITLVEKPDYGDDWVDLGLPSGLLWATRNVGASSPEDYGDYFAWGETSPKEVYDWDTYIYCNGSEYKLTKYCSSSDCGYNGYTDTLTTLQPGDDAATANYGGRTPTEDEWHELVVHTTCQKTTQNGVNGIRFTGSNGNSIFLPAAGHRLLSWFEYGGSNGYYWSNLIATYGPSNAYYLFFSVNSPGLPLQTSSGRRIGYSVRAVRQN